MKKTLFLLMISTFLLINISCQEQDCCVSPEKESKIDMLIFGKYAGFCMGNCTRLFKIEGNKLFADDVDRGVPDEVPFQSNPLSDAQYQKAKELISNFPTSLITSSEKTFGCPDCADQGGFYIEVKYDGKIHKWNVDTSEDALPDYLVTYTRNINEVMKSLSTN
ncbi:hypothetical protein QQ008_02345 [Fulvivirgaceae bacterium BMA10]|uniref:Lipoprotein n=1 Tax=Splendidivirga corallicola TaxID=3051826 RepID=A0ABT8KIB6_9BACT|nr:hypothetical protein [Fulvivirgaceae bacterium BMA10]